MPNQTSGEIFYFSGTGNSLFLAKTLGSRLKISDFVPIISLINKEEIESEAEIIGIVTPIYAFTLPEVVVSFIEKLVSTRAHFIFLITTRYCSSRVFKKVNRILNKKRLQLNAGYCVEMPQNYIPVFEMESEEQLNGIEVELSRKLDQIVPLLNSRENYIENMEAENKWIAILTYGIFPIFTFFYQKTNFFNLEKRYYADSNCTGCNVCTKVCLSQKIRMDNDKPTWQSEVDCYHCMACIHYCPQGAIQIKSSKSKKRGRYHHHSINANAISAQKDYS